MELNIDHLNGIRCNANRFGFISDQDYDNGIAFCTSGKDITSVEFRDRTISGTLEYHVGKSYWLKGLRISDFPGYRGLSRA